jgi:hypothetical protein
VVSSLAMCDESAAATRWPTGFRIAVIVDRPGLANITPCPTRGCHGDRASYLGRRNVGIRPVRVELASHAWEAGVFDGS